MVMEMKATLASVIFILTPPLKKQQITLFLTAL